MSTSSVAGQRNAVASDSNKPGGSSGVNQALRRNLGRHQGASKGAQSASAGDGEDTLHGLQMVLNWASNCVTSRLGMFNILIALGLATAKPAFNKSSAGPAPHNINNYNKDGTPKSEIAAPAKNAAPTTQNPDAPAPNIAA